MVITGNIWRLMYFILIFYSKFAYYILIQQLTGKKLNLVIVYRVYKITKVTILCNAVHSHCQRIHWCWLHIPQIHGYWIFVQIHCGVLDTISKEKIAFHEPQYSISSLFYTLMMTKHIKSARFLHFHILFILLKCGISKWVVIIVAHFVVMR